MLALIPAMKLLTSERLDSSRFAQLAAVLPDTSISTTILVSFPRYLLATDSTGRMDSRDESRYPPRSYERGPPTATSPPPSLTNPLSFDISSSPRYDNGKSSSTTLLYPSKSGIALVVVTS